MEKPTFDWEKKLRERGYGLVAGIDEAGRGPLAGPVVAVAAVARNLEEEENDDQWNLIRDSKTLSEKQRERAYDFVLKKFYVGVGICDQKTIDRINILEASFLAMKKAWVDLQTKIKLKQTGNEKWILLIDGDKKISNFSGEQRAIVQGDKKVKSIAAASIVAKVTRDRLMIKTHKKYPQYGFDKHKGYGTKLHIEALRQFGPTKIHRKSFKPVKNACQRKKIMIN